MRGFSIQSRLAASPDSVWADVITPDGINYELGPWLKMTMPKQLVDATLDTVTIGEPLGRSWILLFGLLPVDYDALQLTEVRERGFSESSSMLSQRVWRHERDVVPDDGGCVVSDRVGWVPRFPGAGVIVAAVAPVLFRHRHARLRARWGGALLNAGRIEL